MKKTLSFILSALILASSALPALPVSAGEEAVEVLSVEHLAGTGIYTVTFSEPVHIFKPGWIWLRQSNPEDGTLQRNLAQATYLGDVHYEEGIPYAEVLQLEFPDPESGFDETSYGLCFVEYFLDDTNEGMVSSQVIGSLDGGGVSGNYISCGLDFCWIPTTQRDADSLYNPHICDLDGLPMQTLPDLSGEYRMMNCDTGRLLSVDGEEWFTFTSQGADSFTLSTGDRYLTVDETGNASLHTDPQSFRLVLNNEYQRFQLYSADESRVLIDTDGGEDASAHTAWQSAPYIRINSGWYLVKAGEPLPLRVAMVGDSITNGCTPDGTLPKTGCRAHLSEWLLEEYERVVFVGSAVASHGGDGSGGLPSTLNTPYLYRSEGHNGWVVTSQEGYTPANNYGIDTLMEPLFQKYNPDMVCMMIGINDIGQLGYYEVNVDRNGIGTAFWGRWTKLVNDILDRLDEEDGRLIIGTLTPQLSSMVNDILLEINGTMASIVTEIGESDPRISLAQHFEHLSPLGDWAVSSDGVHLSGEGSLAMAESYYEAILSVMPERTAQLPPETQPSETDGNEPETEALFEDETSLDSETSDIPSETQPTEETPNEKASKIPFIAAAIALIAAAGMIALAQKKKANKKGE